MQAALKKQEDGFTLIELLVVILVIGVLAAIAVMAFLSQRQKANDASVESDVKNLSKQLETALIADPNAYAFIAADEQQDEFSGVLGSTSVESALSDGVVIAKVEKVRMGANGELVPLAANDTTPVGNGYAITAYHVNGSAHGDVTPLRYDSITGKFSQGIVSSGGGGGSSLPSPELLEETADQLLRLYVNASAEMFRMLPTLTGKPFEESLNSIEVIGITGHLGVLTWLMEEDGNPETLYMPVFMLDEMPPGMHMSMAKNTQGQHVITGYYADGQGQYSASSPLRYNLNNPSLEDAASVGMSNDLFLVALMDSFDALHDKQGVDALVNELGGGSLEQFNQAFSATGNMPADVKATLSIVGGEYHFSAYHMHGVNYGPSNPYVLVIS